MRTFNTAAAALLARFDAGEQVPVVQLVELQLTVTQRLTTAGGPVTWGGHTWLPAQLGIVEAVEDVAGELQGLTFTLPAVSAEQLAVALTEAVEGAVVRVYDALVDPDTGVVADALLAWSGTLNVPTVNDGPQAVISVTAEHRGMLAIRPKPSRYTDDEQQRISAGDTSLQFDPATDAAPLAWPAASYFRK